MLPDFARDAETVTGLNDKLLSMSPRVLQAFELFEGAEKSCWQTLLKEHPEVSKIPTETWKVAIEETLRQLWSILREKSRERGLRAAHLKPMALAKATQCPLDGLLPFFHSGRRALNLIADELMTTLPEDGVAEAEAAVEELRTAFDMLVQWQIEASCVSCTRSPCCWGVVRQADKGGLTNGHVPPKPARHSKPSRRRIR